MRFITSASVMHVGQKNHPVINYTHWKFKMRNTNLKTQRDLYHLILITKISLCTSRSSNFCTAARAKPPWAEIYDPSHTCFCFSTHSVAIWNSAREIKTMRAANRSARKAESEQRKHAFSCWESGPKTHGEKPVCWMLARACVRVDSARCNYVSQATALCLGRIDPVTPHTHTELWGSREPGAQKQN